MNELQLHVPFNETSGDIALDIAQYHYDLSIEGGQWLEGKEDHALYFTGEGLAQTVGYEMIDFSQDFSLSCWFKAEASGEYPHSTWLFYQFHGVFDFLYLDAKTRCIDWTLIEIIQEGRKVRLLVNTHLVAEQDFPDDWGMPMGFSLMNDNNNATGFFAIDELKIYDGVVYQSGTINPPIIKEMDITYKINGNSFKNYGVRVQASTGMFDAPEIKPPVTIEWQDYHGDFVDLNDVRYKSKVIELDCWLYASSAEGFVQKCTSFINQFYGSGTKRLHFDNGIKVFVYEVYLATGLKIEKKWRPSQMIGSFKLTLNEPQPIKRSILFIRNDDNTTASITLNSPKLVTIYWGDGTKTDNVFGEVTKTHTYASNGYYYIIVAGVIEEITSFSTNGIIQNAANSFI